MEQFSVFKKLFKAASFGVICSSLLFQACKPELDELSYNSGDADFSRYVAIGGSYTAGYMDNALTLQGQLQSFPALLASRFQLAGGGAFKQPLVYPGNGLGWDFENNQPIGPFRIVQKKILCPDKLSYIVERQPADTLNLAWIGGDFPYQNMGIPGAKATDLGSTTFGLNIPTGNPFFRRMASDIGQQTASSSTIIGDAGASNPTFFTIWLGTTDVYNFALNGGKNFSQNTYEDITSTSEFQLKMNEALVSLTGNGAKGTIANVPEIDDIPYFTTIPYNGLVLTKQEAEDMNSSAPAGIQFSEGANPFCVYLTGTSGNIRQLMPGELVILNFDLEKLRCNGFGKPGNALGAENVLDLGELDSIRTFIQAYNATINNLAATYGLALADMNALFKTFKSGIRYNGIEMNAEYLDGGVFSTDGMNPNGRGYALIANEFIRAINNKFKSNLPPVDVTSLPGISFP